MAVLKIEPVTIQSVGGHQITLTGIDPTNSDCLHGSIQSGTQAPRNGRWDLGGRMRDASDDCNIDMRDDEISELAALARKLGAE